MKSRERDLSCAIICREDQSVASRYQRAQQSDDVDARYGFERYTHLAEKMGWLINIHPVSNSPCMLQCTIHTGAV